MATFSEAAIKEQIEEIASGRIGDAQTSLEVLHSLEEQLRAAAEGNATAATLLSKVRELVAKVVWSSLPQFSGLREASEIPWSKISLGAPIKTGAFGQVFRATCEGTPCAVKVLNSSSRKSAEAQKRTIAAEVEIQKRAAHPNVVLLLGVSTLPDGRTAIVSELMTSDLEDLIFDMSRTRPVTMEEKLSFLRDAATGLQWLHSIRRVVHHDLKLPNLLVDSNRRVKICDFGLSQVCEKSMSVDKTIRGSPLYQAPEILLKREYNFSADVYSMGLIAFEMISETTIFLEHSNLDEFIDAVARRGERPKFPAAQQDPGRIPPPGLVELVERCWHADPSKRPTFEQMIAEVDEMLLRLWFPDSDMQRLFWGRQLFQSSAPQKEIPWRRFAAVLCRNLGCSEDILRPLRTLLCPQDAPTVTARMFSNAVCWFGDFFIVGTGMAVVRRVTQLLAEPWFHSDLPNSSDAAARLSGSPPGTFLVRTSATDAKANPFAISYILPSGKATSSRIGRDHETGQLFIATSSGMRHEFADLHSLVTAQLQPGSLLKLSTPSSRVTASNYERPC